MFRYDKDITYTVETIDIEKEKVQFIGQEEPELVISKQTDRISIYKNNKHIDTFEFTRTSDMSPIINSIDQIEYIIKQRLISLGIEINECSECYYHDYYHDNYNDDEDEYCLCDNPKAVEYHNENCRNINLGGRLKQCPYFKKYND
ncbi:hypothetical protein [Clostridium sporogenes]|uniref:hypothetical protein n=1 Tax=Clostridium sporogenes TaxID=1509 RepID=UPI0007176292|nr:hypothetical protein [Clostridium sporogenes]KRU46302.1 hypothetical protein VT94_04760 [Clostridium sporogenes]MBY7064377.1 hypothetical protein [Clostridium sporogenes]MBY7071365.1 hypothetical protein [Clostridium sporogenes]MCW6064808.1 hypothetical protein [Clostridium sporogenes]OQP89704.1 hypothetical protein VT93_0201110 [Clostridium sporogenes]